MRIHQKRFLVFFIILLILSLIAIFYYFRQFQYPREVLSYLIPTAGAQGEEEYIDDFQAVVQINPDSTVNVIETIVYNFGDLQRHGIYRDIPYRYFARGGRFTVGFKVLGVTDESGQALPYQEDRQSGSVMIKIGDPDVLITGLKTYKISYSLRRVINFFPDHDEFYWNVTGNEWEVPIGRAGIVVKLPAGVSASSLNAECFTGVLDSTEQNCQVTNVTNSQVGYTSFENLSPGEGLTVVLGWPKGFLTPPPLLTELSWILKDNPLVFLPLLALLIMFLMWYFKGRDLGKKQTTIPFYESPSQLTPVEAGTLIDERVNLRDISATFIELAVKGYLKIKKLEKNDWQLTKVKEFADLTAWQKEFLGDVFAGGITAKVSSLKNHFYKHLPKLKTEVYQGMVAKGYFPASPKKVRNTYTLISIGLLILGLGVLPFFSGSFNTVALIASAAVVFWVGQFMPYKTRAGSAALNQIRGYKLYLEVAEKERIKFHNAPEKTPQLFEKHLPYAMVLGVEKKWAKQFENIYTSQPSWYEGDFAAFNAVIFVNSLNSFDSHSRSALATSPSSAASGGSGFSGGSSGGGFGGGGGGSW